MTNGDLAWMFVIFLPLIVIALGIAVAVVSAARRQRRPPGLCEPGHYTELLRGGTGSQTAVELACEESLRRSLARRREAEDRELRRPVYITMDWDGYDSGGNRR